MLPRRSPEPVAVSCGNFAARVPLAQAAAVQAGACLLILAFACMVPVAALGGGDAMTWALAQGIVAARLGRGAGMQSWWFPMHALFVPGMVWMLGLGVSPLFWLGVFCLLASVYWSVSRTRVPLFLSNRATVRALADLLPQECGFAFLDLGCGLGGVLSRLARARPAGRYYGIEAAPLPFVLGRVRAAFAARSCRIDWGDFCSLDLGRYDVVYAYLSPAAMGDLWQKAKREMRPGSLLISNSFAIPGVPPSRTVATNAAGDSTLLLWRM
jgi:hypothetical protein